MQLLPSSIEADDGAPTVSGVFLPVGQPGLHQPVYELASRRLTDPQNLSELTDSRRSAERQGAQTFHLRHRQVEIDPRGGAGGRRHPEHSELGLKDFVDKILPKS